MVLKLLQAWGFPGECKLEAKPRQESQGRIRESRLLPLVGGTSGLREGALPGTETLLAHTLGTEPTTSRYDLTHRAMPATTVPTWSPPLVAQFQAAEELCTLGLFLCSWTCA